MKAIEEALNIINAERERLNTLIAQCQDELDKLEHAAELLGGQPSQNKAGELKPVTEIALELAKKIASENATPGKVVVFDFKIILAKAQEVYPSDFSRIKRGIYTAFASLKKKGQIHLTAGGYRLP